jgi:uncharacterized coiled-coil protein SlyX
VTYDDQRYLDRLEKRMADLEERVTHVIAPAVSELRISLSDIKVTCGRLNEWLTELNRLVRENKPT